MADFRRILAVLEAGEDLEDGLSRAVALARGQNATLSLLLIVPPELPAGTPFGGFVIAPTDPNRALRRALDLIPSDVAFTYRLEPHSCRASIEREIREGADLVVLGRGSRHRLVGWPLDLRRVRLARLIDVPVLLL